MHVRVQFRAFSAWCDCGGHAGGHGVFVCDGCYLNAAGLQAHLNVMVPVNGYFSQNCLEYEVLLHHVPLFTCANCFQLCFHQLFLEVPEAGVANFPVFLPPVEAGPGEVLPAHGVVVPPMAFFGYGAPVMGPEGVFPPPGHQLLDPAEMGQAVFVHEDMLPLEGEFEEEEEFVVLDEEEQEPAAPVPFVVAGYNPDENFDEEFEDLVDDFIWRGAGVGPADGNVLPPLPEEDIPYAQVAAILDRRDLNGVLVNNGLPPLPAVPEESDTEESDLEESDDEELPALFPEGALLDDGVEVEEVEVMQVEVHEAQEDVQGAAAAPLVDDGYFSDFVESDSEDEEPPLVPPRGAMIFRGPRNREDRQAGIDRSHAEGCDCEDCIGIRPNGVWFFKVHRPE